MVRSASPSFDPREEDLDRLGDLVALKMGIALSQDRHRRRVRLRRALTDLARDRALPESALIRDLLDGPFDEAAASLLAPYVTVGETYFFRERRTLDLFRRDVLGPMAAERDRKSLRLWSAGCSTGEEPYTLAMILDETAGLDGLDEVSVLGTDINERALARAREGVYGRWSLRGLDDEALARYFQPLDGGRYSVRERYRRAVTFLSHNLASTRGLPWPAGTVAGIFCRNVLIYFDGPLRERLLDFFHRFLAPGGWLIVAPCETSALVASRFRAHHADGVTLYRKGGPEPLSRTAFFDVAFGESLVAAAPEEGATALLESSLRQEEPQGGEILPVDALFQEPLSAFESSEAPVVADDDGLRQARQAADGGRLDEALILCLARLDQDRTDPEAFFLLSMIHQEQGEAEKALGALRRVLFLAPDFLGAHYALAMIELGRGRKDQARRHFRNALSLLERMAPEEPVAGGGGMTAAEFRALLEAGTI